MVSIQNEVGGSVEIIHENFDDRTGQPVIKFFARLQSTSPNQNKRTYNAEALQKIVSTLRPISKNYGLLGELDHPILNTPIKTTDRKWTDEEVTMLNASHLRNSTVLLERVCVAYDDLHLRGNEIVSNGKTLTINKGRDAYALFKDDIGNIGFSSRISGRYNKNGIIIPESISAYTYDLVYRPSHKNAVVIEFIHENRSIWDSISEIDRTILSLGETLEKSNEIILESRTSGIPNFNNNITECPNGICTINNLRNTSELREVLIHEAYQNLTKPLTSNTILTITL